MIKSKLGIPYMGSKRSLAKPILDFIIEQNPNAKYFYDLFGGGGSMSFEALQRKQFKEVYYNELNTSIVSLLNKIKEDGVTDEFYEWVSREDFKEYKNDSDWKSGLIQTCWSFGSNQKGYLYGIPKENNKRLMHNIIVNRCIKSLNIINGKYNLSIELGSMDESINNRRLRVQSSIFDMLDDDNIEGVGSFMIVKNSTRNVSQHLQNIDKLKKIENLYNLKNLEISNQSAFDVKINTPIEETIIYLDPPYIKTGQYKEKLNHDELYEYIENSPYKIYMSSYESHLPSVFQINHRSTLSAKNNNKKVVEKLFTNTKPILNNSSYNYYLDCDILDEF